MENFEKNPKEKELATEEAMMQIKLVRQEVALMGANDSELNDLNNLVQQVESGEIRT